MLQLQEKYFKGNFWKEIHRASLTDLVPLSVPLGLDRVTRGRVLACPWGYQMLWNTINDKLKFMHIDTCLEPSGHKEKTCTSCQEKMHSECVKGGSSPKRHRIISLMEDQFHHFHHAISDFCCRRSTLSRPKYICYDLYM